MNLKQQIIDKRGPYCESGSGKIGHDLHHCLIPRQKRYRAWLDTPENLMLVNHYDHIAGTFDTWQWRCKFWQMQCKRYGLEHMETWIDSLPAKLKHRIDFVERTKA